MLFTVLTLNIPVDRSEQTVDPDQMPHFVAGSALFATNPAVLRQA